MSSKRRKRRHQPQVRPSAHVAGVAPEVLAEAIERLRLANDAYPCREWGCGQDHERNALLAAEDGQKHHPSVDHLVRAYSEVCMAAAILAHDEAGPSLLDPLAVAHDALSLLLKGTPGPVGDEVHAALREMNRARLFP